MAHSRLTVFIVAVFALLLSGLNTAPAVTLPELTARVEKLSRAERARSVDLDELAKVDRARHGHDRLALQVVDRVTSNSFAPG